MATILEQAIKGQRAAMTALYEANKQKVYFVASCLLSEPQQAEAVTLQVFQQIWSGLRSTGIATEERFTNYLICRVIELCKERVCRTDPEAFKLPRNKRFTLPANWTVGQEQTNELKYLLENLPPIQKYIFVMRTAGALEVIQIARILKLDARTVRGAIEAEGDNFLRLQRLSKTGFATTYPELIDGMAQAEAEAQLPPEVDRTLLAEIDRIAAPVEQRANRRKRYLLVVTAVAAVCLAVGGSVFALRAGEPQGSDATQPPATGTTTAAENQTQPTGETTPEETQPEPVLDAQLDYYADICIKDYGTVTVALDQEAAPITVANFVELARSGFYDGLTFHRIMEGFMMQGGCPEGTGFGGAEEEIKGEFSENGYDNPLSHTRGAISMARASAYDSASSQFFIVHEDATDSLDGKYAAFGHVTEGMEVVDAICQAAKPTDSNGSIAPEDQPVITGITIRTEPAG